MAGHFAGREMFFYSFGGATRGDSGWQRLRSVNLLARGSSVFGRSLLRLVAAVVDDVFVHSVAASSFSS